MSNSTELSKINYYEEVRPWGKFQQFSNENSPMVKIITILPGHSTSLQTHQNRDEYWHIISGDGNLIINTEEIAAQPDGNYFIPRTVRHRISGGKMPLVLLEISTGVFDENDIIRIEDNYGRTSEK